MPKSTSRAARLAANRSGASSARASKTRPKGHPPGKDVAGRQDVGLELKRHLEQTRLPAKLRKQILAELPSWEEEERLYRRLQKKGGLSLEQFLRSLGIEVDRQP
jgi:hypothetical protein